ncbi:MAG: hypothetical protein JST54_01145 [Deltaproteobacteria bacterium]|nr:hypothetical protein [Deltaproteobacteria bacterium]
MAPLKCYAGICQLYPYAAGEACPTDAGVVWCDAFGSLCTAVPDGGAACLPAPGLGEACTQICAPWYSCTGGTCTAPAGLGDSCSSQPCGGFLYCASGTCALEPKLGEPCNDAGPMCLAGFCDVDSGICTAIQPPFGPCTEDVQCIGAGTPGYSGFNCRGVPPDGGSGYCDTCEPR